MSTPLKAYISHCENYFRADIYYAAGTHKNSLTGSHVTNGANRFNSIISAIIELKRSGVEFFEFDDNCFA